jgi:Ca2+/Na+ antiporter
VGKEDVTALIAFFLLLVMLVIGARFRGVRFSFWKLLAFIAACVVVLACYSRYSRGRQRHAHGLG